MVDTQAIYRAAVRRADEQDVMAKAFKAREKRVEVILKSLFACLQLQATQNEMLIKRMMFGVG